MCFKTVNGYYVSLRHHRSTERNSSLSHLVSTDFSQWNRCWRRTEFCWDGWHRITGWWSSTVWERILCYL